jgi:hypothetical protein
MTTKPKPAVKADDISGRRTLLAKAAAALLGRKTQQPLDPGNYSFRGQITLALDCDITKGAPETYIPTSALPLKAILAMCLARAGFQRDKIKELILEAAHEALSDGFREKVADYLEVTNEALATVELTLAKLPEGTRDGKTLILGKADIIDVAPYGEAAWHEKESEREPFREG